ncbi:DUF998 domain-containing protein [Nocardioides antri]|nr:DUF998 domain-containing protein [Nocardioides antri]
MTFQELDLRPRVAAPRLAWFRTGVAAGPLFLLLSLLQLPLKDGFDLSRHAFSYLALGAHGWIQQLNFVTAGVLFILATHRLRRSIPGRTRHFAASFGMLMGAGMVVAGVFTVDPSFGFPEGAPAGRPDTVSASGMLHGVGFVVSMTAWVALLVALGLWLRSNQQRPWSRACFVLAAGLLLVPAVAATPAGTIVLYVVVSSAFIFTSAVLDHVSRRAGSPDHVHGHGHARGSQD